MKDISLVGIYLLKIQSKFQCLFFYHVTSETRLKIVILKHSQSVIFFNCCSLSPATICKYSFHLIRQNINMSKYKCCKWNLLNLIRSHKLIPILFRLLNTHYPTRKGKNKTSEQKGHALEAISGIIFWLKTELINFHLWHLYCNVSFVSTFQRFVQVSWQFFKFYF